MGERWEFKMVNCVEWKNSNCGICGCASLASLASLMEAETKGARQITHTLSVPPSLSFSHALLSPFLSRSCSPTAKRKRRCVVKTPPSIPNPRAHFEGSSKPRCQMSKQRKTSGASRGPSPQQAKRQRDLKTHSHICAITSLISRDCQAQMS